MLSITLSENKETLIAKDLNCDYAKIDCSKDLKDVLKLYNFKQVISKPTRITRISSSLIDIIATTHNEHITKSFLFPNSISDHDLIGIIRRINCKRFTPRKILARSYKNYDANSFLNDLNNIHWNDFLNINNLNDAWDEF